MRYCCLLLLSCFALFGAEIDWDKAQTVQTGVKLIKLENTEPRLQKINVMRIDLRTKGLRFTATGRDADYGKPMPDHEKFIIQTKRTRTREFLLNSRKNGLNMIVAVNAAPWRPWEKPFDHKYGQLTGLNISDGVIVSDSKNSHAIFVVYKDGKTDIVASVPEEDYPKIQLASTGFTIILKNGGNLMNDDQAKPQPRTAYGLSADRHYMYIATIDGRQQDWSMGATLKETAAILKDAGSSDGINMDGGGSTTLYYWDAEKDQPVTLARHTKDGYERTVASSIGLYLIEN